MGFNSEQEELCHRLIGRAGGSAWLFVPDLYRKKNKRQREPCDMVWACNGCVALFYLTGIERSLEKANDHNLQQARRWLQVWRRGDTRLRGKNAFQEFDIGPTDYPHIVIFSVVNCAGQTGAFHIQEARTLDVTVVTTITQGDLSALANAGATLYDAITLAYFMRRNPQGWTPHMSAEYTDFTGRNAQIANLTQFGNGVAEAVRHATTLVLGMRSPDGDTEAVSAPDATGPFLTCSEVFADLLLRDFLQLTYTIATLLQWCWPAPHGPGRIAAHTTVGLDPCKVRIEVATSSEHLVKRITTEPPVDGADGVPTILAIFLTNGFAIVPMWTIPPMARKSQTEALLDKIRALKDESLA